MSFDENIKRVERKGWAVDRSHSYRSYGVDHIYGNSADGNYGVGIGFDSQSGRVKQGTIIKDPNGIEDRVARRWEPQSIPTPTEVADAFERPAGGGE